MTASFLSQLRFFVRVAQLIARSARLSMRSCGQGDARYLGLGVRSLFKSPHAGCTAVDEGCVVLSSCILMGEGFTQHAIEDAAGSEPAVQAFWMGGVVPAAHRQRVALAGVGVAASEDDGLQRAVQLGQRHLHVAMSQPSHTDMACSFWAHMPFCLF